MKHCQKILMLFGLVSAASYSIEESGFVIEEIQVTAQKVEEGIQSVPVTVNAVSGESFRQYLSNDLRDVGKLMPGLVMESTGNNQNVTLRGIGTKIAASQSPRTNVFIEGAYISAQQLAFLSQYDIARFEVLRGPQGTLYGKASPTGTIIIHTASPNLESVDGYVRQTVGESDLVNTEFGVSLPIIEGELGVRLSGVYDENNNRDYQYLDHSDPKARTRSGRVVVLWEPAGSKFDLRLYYQYLENTSAIPVTIGDTLDDRWGVNLDPFDRVALDDTPRDLNIRYSQAVAEANYDFGEVTLSYLGYYAESTNDSVADQDFTPVADSVREVNINLNGLTNHEFRLTSGGDDFWDWIVGIYYGKSKGDSKVDNRSALLVSAPIEFDPSNSPGVTADLWVPATLRVDINLLTGTEDFGAFTHNTLYLTDDLTLTLGARWTRERRDNKAPFAFEVESFGMITPLAAEFTSSENKYIEWTGTAKLAYQIAEEQLVYGTVDLGGRGGGQGLDLQATTPDNMEVYEPEDATSIELGYKSTLNNGRLRFNAALYYQTYTDYQIQREAIINDPFQELSNFTVIQNADRVIAQGIELDLTYLVSEGFQTNLSVSYNDTKFDDFKDAVCNEGDPQDLGVGEFFTCDLSGQRVGGDAGNWSVVASANFLTPIPNSGFEWYVDALMNFTSERVSSITDKKTSSYATFDLFTGVRGGPWDVKLWAKNIFNKEAIEQSDRTEQNIEDTSLILTPVLPGQMTSIPTGVIPLERVVHPRQIGATVTYRFE